MSILPVILMLGLCAGFAALAKRRPVIEGRRNGPTLYRGLHAALLLAFVSLLCWQVFSMGFEMGGDVARRDARDEARAAANA
ncbi:hypothetical protein [Brevundimonas sp.]|uniref:hypothetical protein n=1 Tax=Brevundimonas sp. TaxID=1871086 RepID=UPI002FC95DF8